MKNLILIITISLGVLVSACGPGGAAAGKTIKSGTVGGMSVTIASPDGVLHKGKQDLTVTIADSSGKPVDVGAASLNFFMPSMGSMAAMNNAATLATTSTPGVYAAKVDIEMAGEWQAQVKFDGPAGKGSGNIPITAQ